MSPQYREHGRRKLTPLPPSPIEHPWVLVRNTQGREVAYLFREHESGYIGVLLLLGFIYSCWTPAEESPRLHFVPIADVLHVFPHEPTDVRSIDEARRKLEGRL